MTRYPCGDAADGVLSDQHTVLPAAHGCASVTQPSPAVILQLHSAVGASPDRILREAGFRVIQTESRETLWRLLQEIRPDLVLLDADEIPSLLDLCRTIKSHRDHRHRRLLMISRQAGAASRVAALNGGADGYLTEPADPEELLATVRALLRTVHNCVDVDAAIREREERLRLFVRDAPVGIAMLDRDMRYLAVSRRWADDYRLDEQALIGRCHYEVFPDMPERWKAEHQRCLAGAIQQAEEEVVSLLTGRVKWNRWQVRPWRDAGGEIGGLVMLFEDITERKRGQQALRKAHTFLRQVIDMDPNFIFVKDREGRFTLVNQAVADCYGTTVQNLIGKTDGDFNDRADEVARFRRQDQEVMDTLKERCIPEELITDAAGNRRWLQTMKRPIFDEQGQAVQLLGVSADITQRKQAEESLARQLYLTRTITDNSTQALFLLDERGFCTCMNPAAEAMFGFTWDEIQNKPLHEMIHHHYPDGRPYPVSECAINRSLTDGRPLREHEDVFIRKNGESFPVLVAASPVLNRDLPISTVIEVRDVTEQMRDRQALARMTDRLELILRSAGEGICGVDRAGCIAFINPAGAALFGCPQEQLLGRDLHRLLHHAHPAGPPYEADRCPLDAVLHDGKPRDGNEETLWIADGHPVSVAYTCSPMLEEGHVVGAVLVLRNITEGRRVQDALRESEERLRLALAAGQMGAWDVDLTTGRTRWDERECALLGEEADCVVPDPGLFFDRVHPDDREAVRRRVEVAVQTGDLQQEFRIVHRDGQVRWLASRALVLNDEHNRPRRMVGVNFDITERKQMEERMRSFTLELEWRVAQRTNDLRQSQARLRALATELNLAEQRERKRLATDLHDYLAQLLVLVRLKLGQIKRASASGGDRAALLQSTEEVVNEALAYTRTLVAQLSPPVLHEFGLPAALKWLGQQMVRQELSVSVTQAVPDTLPLPEDLAVLLFQSVRELLINVRKHACVQDAQVSMERTGNELRITVRDEGAGIDLTAASETSDLSSKFGLFSIGERMRAIGGRFELVSVPGGGTTARLVTPLHVEAENHVNPAEQAREAPLNREAPVPPDPRLCDVSPIRVLLVDDHMMIREGLRGLLKDHPDVAVVGEAWDGEEGLAFTDRLRPDVVIMDVNMPKMDGIEATRRIKAAFRSIAVIGLSVNASHQVVEAMVASGADAVLSKEAAGEQIYRTIKALGPGGAHEEPAKADGGMEEGP